MKKILLSIAVLGIIGTANAQKLALVEEFSGENCGPCAAQNPGFMALLETPSNASKVLLLKYQSPIPSAGPIYLANTAFTDARMDYYQVGFAPYARINGNHEVAENNPTAIQQDAVGMIGYAQQSDIDNAAAESTNFTMSISDPVYDDNGQFTATITVTATAATTESNTKLRVALAEELQYSTAPGTNGETHFQNVVRQMYPDADGQAIDASWTVNQTRTYTVSGFVPSYVNEDAPSVFLAAFLQNDTTKEVLQATRTDGNIDIEKASNDVAFESASLGSSLICEVPATVSDATVTIKNTGSEELTSATIKYRVYGEETWQTYDWTGTIESGETENVTIPSFEAGSSAGLNYIEFEISDPNGLTDYNNYDNIGEAMVGFVGEPQEFPASNGFETDTDPNWFPFIENGNQYPFIRMWYGDNSYNIGHNNSVWTIAFQSHNLPVGTRGYYMLPKVDLPEGEDNMLNFYLSYAVRGGTQGDKLEVLTSNDCGATWEVIWEAQGNDLATTEPTEPMYLHIPDENTWQLVSVDISEMSSDNLFAFRATSGGSNYIWVDDVMFTNSASIDEVMDTNELKLFPNPTADILNVSLTMKMSESVNFTVINSIGQEVMNVTETLSEGNQQTTLNVSNLAAGVYILNINTEGGSTQRKFVKN